MQLFEHLSNGLVSSVVISSVSNCITVNSLLVRINVTPLDVSVILQSVSTTDQCPAKYLLLLWVDKRAIRREMSKFITEGTQEYSICIVYIHNTSLPAYKCLDGIQALPCMEGVGTLLYTICCISD